MCLVSLDSSQNATFAGDVQVTGAFKDSSGDAGTSGQVLSSTATGTNWIDNDTGDISGSGVAGEVAYFTGTKTIANNAGMSFSNQQVSFDGIGGADGYVLPYDQNPGYSNMAAGGFGLLFRESYDSYVTNNTYYYKTGGTAQWRAKYTNKGASVLSMLDGKFTFDTAPANTTSPHSLTLSPRMTILESGNIGIGTTSPGKLLSVIGADGRNVTTYLAEIVNNDNTSDQGHGLLVGGGNNANHHLFQVNASGSAVFVIKGDGIVGIGETSPSSLLHLKKATGDPMINIQAVASGDPGITFTSINNRTGNIFYSDGTTNAMLRYDHADVSFKLYAHNTTVADLSLIHISEPTRPY